MEGKVPNWVWFWGVALLIILCIKPLRKAFFALVCQIVFNPVVCGVLTIIWCILYSSVYSPLLRQSQSILIPLFSSIPIPQLQANVQLASDVVVLAIIAVVVGDSIRDICIGRRFYNYNINVYRVHIGPLLLVKGLACLFTLGLARAVYVVVVYPILKHIARKPLRLLMKNDKPIVRPRYGSHGIAQWRIYYWNQYERRLIKRGTLVSASDVVYREISQLSSKHASYEPKTFFKKVARKFNWDKNSDERQMQRSLDSAMNDARAASDICMSRKTINAVGTECFAYLQGTSNPVAPDIIARDDRMKRFDASKTINGSSNWFQYFVILGLEPYVARGEIEDRQGMTNRGVKNHVYARKGARLATTTMNGDSW